MLFKDAFKAKSYSKIFGVGFYTPVGGWVTVQTRVGKQNSISATKIPEKIFNALKLDDNDKSITNLSDFPCLSIVKDEDTGFKRLVYTDPNKKVVEDDAGED